MEKLTTKKDKLKAIKKSVTKSFGSRLTNKDVIKKSNLTLNLSNRFYGGERR